jgi:hypothetical protein
VDVAAAVGQLLDEDTVVQQQREALQRLQEQWTDKLRQAEIDISRERAQLARQRVELEEKNRVMETRRTAAEGEATGGAAAGPSGRGRWLARLELKDAP